MSDSNLIQVDAEQANKVVGNISSIIAEIQKVTQQFVDVVNTANQETKGKNATFSSLVAYMAAETENLKHLADTQESLNDSVRSYAQQALDADDNSAIEAALSNR